MVIQRTFQLTQIKGNMRFKALDGVIRVVNDLGEKVSMNHKCGELDRHIPEMLGVSKTILESVIFCHQEESNWPLLEGAELKKRFDGIFESARYTKALDAIQKLKKARVSDTKDYKRDLEVLNHKMKTAQDIRDKIDSTKEKLHKVGLSMDDREKSLKVAEDTLAEMERLLRDIQGHHSALRQQQRSIAEKRETIDDAYERLGQVMNDSDEELQALLSNYDGLIADHAKSLDELKEKRDELQHEKDVAQREYGDLRTQRGVIDGKIDDLESQVTRFVDSGREFGTKYGFYSRALSAQNDEVEAFIAKFKETLEAKRNAVKEKQTANDATASKLNAEVADLSGSLKRNLDDTTKSKSDLDAVAKENDKLNSEITGLSHDGLPSERQLQDLDRRISEAEKSLATFEKEHSIVDVKTEIDRLRKAKLDKAFEADEAQKVVASLQTYEREHMKFQTQQNDCLSKREEFDASLAEKRDSLQSLLIGTHSPINSKSLAVTLKYLDERHNTKKEECAAREQELSRAQQKCADSQAAINGAEAMLASHRRDKTELERHEMATIRQLLAELVPGEDVTNAELGLRTAESLYLEAKDKTLRCKNTITFLSIFKQKGQRDQCCPLCQRGMNAQEIDTFVRAVNDKTDDKKIKDKILKAESKEEQALARWKEMDKLMPSWRKWMELEAQIPVDEDKLSKLKASHATIESDVHDANVTLESERTLLRKLEDGCRELNELIKVDAGLVHIEKQIQSENERLQQQLKEIAGFNVTSLAAVQEDSTAKRNEVRHLDHQLTEKHTELEHLQELLDQHRDDVRRRKDEKLELQEKRTQYEAALAKLEQLRKREKELNDAIMRLTVAEPALNRQLRLKTSDLEAWRKSSDVEMDALRRDLGTLEGDYRSFSFAFSNIRNVNKHDLEKQRSRVDERLRQCEQRQATTTADIGELTSQIDAANETIANQLTFKRQLDDNLTHRRLERELAQMVAEAKEIKDKINALPELQVVEDRVNAAKSSVNEVGNSIARLDGQRNQLIAQGREYKIQLRGEDLRNVDEQYRLKLIQFETTMMAVADLDRFYKALDESLLEFHSKKVEEINAIIRQLWQITYKGQDIDTIELVSGQQGETTSKASRSYDYRVVMRKAGAMIDMRGRCSAGQKVLAALVIRLALAETFCLNCGILALDEPTTNLDTENKYGLAQGITE